MRYPLVIPFVLLFAFVFYGNAAAQFDTSVEMTAVGSSSDYTPFWLQSNRHGIIGGQGSHFQTRLQAHGDNKLWSSGRLYYGADLVARPGVESTLSFKQGYLRLEAYGLFLAAGRFHNTSPIHDEELGMGSLGVSGNAVPIPQVRAGLTDWTSLPFTRDFVQIKGYMMNGWLGSRRYTEDVLLHEKVGHARFGGDLPINLYGGLAHYVKWGGNNPDHGQIPVSLRDFGRAFFALGGGEDSPGSFRAYMYGDHLGAWDFGFFLELGDTDIKVYRQFPLESKDNLKFKSLQDALTGLNIQFADPKILGIRAFTYEFLYTMHQDGPRRPNTTDDGRLCFDFPDECRDRYRGNENYYNHEIYRTGWVYQKRTIGNPLFIPSTDPRIGVFNNRIVAHHLGINFQLPRQIRLTTKATFSRNYGKRWDNRIPEDPEKDPLFDPYLNQFSFFAGMEIPVNWQNRNFTLKAETGIDAGDLVGSQFGMLLGLRWQP